MGYEPPRVNEIEPFEMTSFQALITGAILGALNRAPESGFLIDVEPLSDQDGNFLPLIKVIGKESGEVLRVSVGLWDSPLTLEEAVNQLRAEKPDER